MFPEDLPQLCNHERYEVNVTIKRILVLMTDGVQFTMDQMIKMTLWLVNCIICTCVFCSHPTCWFLHTAGGKEKR